VENHPATETKMKNRRRKKHESVFMQFHKNIIVNLIGLRYKLKVDEIKAYQINKWFPTALESNTHLPILFP
jgi:hypothetical protein